MTLDLPPRSDVVLDTNLAVLACSGGVPFKNTSAFDRVDYDLLNATVQDRRLFVLPFIVAETSNLLAQGGSQGTYRLQLLAEFVRAAEEGAVTCRDAVGHPRFAQLGATDAAILTWLERHRAAWLITVDFVLAAVAGHAGLNALNFNHIRDAARA